MHTDRDTDGFAIHVEYRNGNIDVLIHTILPPYPPTNTISYSLRQRDSDTVGNKAGDVLLG